MDYDPYGIYFNVRFTWEFRNKTSNGKGYFDTRLNVVNLKYKRRCGSTTGPYTQSGIGSSMGTSYSKSWPSYQGSKPLNELCFKFSFNLASDPTNVKTNQLIIAKNCTP